MNKKGFTLVEVLLVITLLAISLGFAAIYNQSSQLHADINSQAAVLVSHLRLAQSNANAGLSDAPNAIHFENSSYTTFLSNGGTPFNISNPGNFEINLPATISIQNIALNGGGADLIFSPPRGETTNHGSIQISSNQIAKTITININSLGSVSY